MFWIARNKGKWGGLFLYLGRPTKKLDGSFDAYVGNGIRIALNPKDFPEVTFENSPVEVELKIKEEQK